MDPTERDAQITAHLTHMLSAVLHEAHAWPPEDDAHRDLVTVAEHLAAGHLPQNHHELFVLLTLHRLATERAARALPTEMAAHA